jgi:hypothetical protein
MGKKHNRQTGLHVHQQANHEHEAMQRYGADTVKQSIARWNSYTAEQQDAVKAEGMAIYHDLVAAMSTGHDSEHTQAILVRWHHHMRYFYEPSIEVLGGLGQTYINDPDFHAFFAAIDPDLPAFISKAVAVYVDTLETRWLEQELDILEH